VVAEGSRILLEKVSGESGIESVHLEEISVQVGLAPRNWLEKSSVEQVLY
jgi:hypothetical protein